MRCRCQDHRATDISTTTNAYEQVSAASRPSREAVLYMQYQRQDPLNCDRVVVPPLTESTNVPVSTAVSVPLLTLKNQEDYSCKSVKLLLTTYIVISSLVITNYYTQQTVSVIPLLATNASLQTTSHNQFTLTSSKYYNNSSP